MKKAMLMVAIVMVWGCSQVSDAEIKDQAVEAVKSEVAEMQDQAVEAAKEKVMDAATAKAEDAVDGIASKAIDAAPDQVTDTLQKKVSEVVPSAASASEFQPGIHYTVINPAWEDPNQDQVVVYEFFGYLCPHCYSFQPYMQKLESQLPENAKLQRVPVVFRAQWKPFAQAYYTIENLGLTEELHTSLFEAIHTHRKPLRTIEDIATWAASAHGVDKDKFLSTAQSFMVDGLIRKGDQMMRAMQIQGTPTLVVNGQYKPDKNALKTGDRVIDATVHLTEKAVAVEK